MEQFLIFLKGFGYILSFIIGAVCGVFAISSKNTFGVVCGIAFLALWTTLFILFMNGKRIKNNLK